MKHKNVGNFIKKMRIGVGLYQSQLGDQIGYSEAFISKIEKGTSRLPFSKVNLLCVVLECDRHELLKIYLQDFKKSFYEVTIKKAEEFNNDD